MKFIGYSFASVDVEAIIAKYKKIQEERKQFPDRYPRMLKLDDGTPVTFMVRSRKAIQFYEATEEQLINLSSRWLPEVTWEFVPLLDKIKFMEAYHLPSLDQKNQPHKM